MSKVIITRCLDYSESSLRASLLDLFKHLGGLDSFVKPGQRVLLKVNALMALEPDAACTTHPALVKVLAQEILKIGAIPIIGDSPGGMISKLEHVYEKCGFKQVADELNIELANFQSEGVTTLHSKLPFYISNFVLACDVIISLPKMKTHMLTRFTGAIKNMFGTVPGSYKTQLHFDAPHPADFAQVLADIYFAAKPALNIMDAVIGMEGTGPSAGIPIKSGLLLASTDGVALDSVASSICGFPEKSIPLINIAAKEGYGVSDLKQIKIVGEELSSVKISIFKKPPNISGFLMKIPRPLFNLFRPLVNRIRINPVIKPETCTACQTCSKACPQKCITVQKGRIYKINHGKCIMCFCCHELCPYKAIELKVSMLARIFGLGTGT